MRVVQRTLSLLALLVVTLGSHNSIADEGHWSDCLIYAPVCASDGYTYTNECLANWFGYTVAYQGFCSYCDNDTECSDGYTCSNGTCMPPVATGCTSDDQCGENGFCWDGDCYSYAECQVDSDCAEGNVCYYGTCTPDTPPSSECQVDADCGAGFMCLGGTCFDAPTCNVDSDCPEGYACQDGICTQG